jgi:hypothetical protein
VTGAGSVADPFIIIGGPLVYANAAALPTPGVDSPEGDEGAWAWVLDEGALYYSDGAAWNLFDLLDPPGCHIYKTGTQTITAGLAVGEVLTFSGEQDDSTTMHAPGASEVTIAVPGVYVVHGQVMWEQDANNDNAWGQVRLGAAGNPVGGSGIARSSIVPVITAENQSCPMGVRRRFAAGNVLEMFAACATNNHDTSGGAAGQTFLTVQWVAP